MNKRRMPRYAKIVAALGIGLVSLLGRVDISKAQQNPVTAIDIALEPGVAMVQRAQAANARLRKAFPKGFALDATHHPHITMLQQFVRTADLDKVYAAVNKVLAAEKPTSWKLRADRYYYIPAPPIGLAGIVVEPTEDLRRLQQEIIDAVIPLTVKNGDAGRIHEHRERPRHPKVLDRIRIAFCEHCGWQEIQSACHYWCRHHTLSEKDACRTIRCIRILTGGSVDLPAWQFWYGPQGTQGFGLDVLRHLSGKGQ